MSVDKLVDSTQLDADLTSVANAIRIKGGTSAQLAFPADFVAAIAAIPSGGGGTTIHAPYKVCSGQITPASTSSSISLPLGDSGLTALLFVLVLCDDYANWSTKYSNYKRAVLGSADYLKANSINTGADFRQIMEITDAGALDYWSGTAGHTISISGTNVVITSAKSGLYFKPEIPMNYIIIGV